MTDSPPDVSVVVPVRNGAASILRCLDALGGQHGPSYEVIVVDNGSTDGTGDLARAHAVVTRVVEEERPGSYAARNAGIAASRADVLAFTDVDCTPQPGWLTAGLAAVVADGADLAGGAIRAERSTTPTVWERYDRAVYLRQEDLVVHSGWAVTANLFIRRDVVNAVGEFDATLPSSGDREFCLRAGRAGFRLVYAADALVQHRPRTTAHEIWALNRRVGAGMGLLARRGELPPWWRSREHWMQLGWVWDLVQRDGPPLRRRQLLPVHAVAMAARLYGRLRRR